MTFRNPIQRPIARSDSKVSEGISTSRDLKPYRDDIPKFLAI